MNRVDGSKSSKSIALESLNNTGIEFIGEKKVIEDKEKTLVVVGVARGGTSLISGSLDKLGVFTGKGSASPVYEDINLANAFEKGQAELVDSMISEYNQEYAIWAFKRPHSIEYLEEINNKTRNPIYLFVFKDIFSIANRNSISMKHDVKEGLVGAHNSYLKILNFIVENNINAFLFSYDKIMMNKERFIDTLISLVGKNKVSDHSRMLALDFINPVPADYLNISRITRSVGKVGFADRSKIIGWGKYIQSEEPAQIELYINDKLKEVKYANDYREHVKEAKIHSTGKCGFIFDLKDFPLREGDKVSVKLSDDIHYLYEAYE